MAEHETERIEEKTPHRESALRTYTKRTIAGIALAGSIAGGVFAGIKMFDDGVPNCGDTLSPSTSSFPNARIDIGGEHYGIDIDSFGGRARLEITKGKSYLDRQSNIPVAVELVPNDDGYTGSVKPQDSSDVLHVALSSDLGSMETSCS